MINPVLSFREFFKEMIMATLSLQIDDTALAQALTQSQELGVSLDEFITNLLNTTLIGTNQQPKKTGVSVEYLLETAVSKAISQPANSEFMLVDLYHAKDWEALSGGERKSLGKGFRKAVEGIEPPIARYVRRTGSNKAVYKRV